MRDAVAVREAEAAAQGREVVARLGVLGLVDARGLVLLAETRKPIVYLMM